MSTVGSRQPASVCNPCRPVATPGALPLVATLARWLGKDPVLEYPVGLERDNQILLKPFCPPYYKSMEDAVAAFLQAKFGEDGSYRGGIQQSAWRNSASSSVNIPAPSPSAVEATVAYCDYVFRRYGRFPTYTAPFRTVIGFQVCRVDVDFYDRFYEAEALSNSVRNCTKQALLNANA
jgi:hypothetical protein